MVVLIVILGIVLFVGIIIACMYGYYAYDEGDTHSRWAQYKNTFISPFNQLYDYGYGKQKRGRDIIARNRIRSEQNNLKREIRAERKTNKGVKSDG